MLSDLRFGFRVLRKSPGFWLAAALMLGLGIAANCAFFSVAYAVLYRPLPYRNPGELLQVFYGEKGGQATRSPFMDDFFDWRDRNRVFEDMGMVQRTFGAAVRIDDRPENLRAFSCTANLFSLLGVEPLLGRTFSTEEGTPGRNDVVVLGHAYWRERFHEDPNILGKEIGLWDGSRFVTKVVIGVLPPLRKAVQAVEPNGVIEISSLEEAVAGQSMHLRFLTILTSGAGLLGLLLGATGVFSITAYTVRRQAVEFGIRIAMGAVPRDVMRIVLRDNSCMAAIGAAFGIAVILALGRVLRSILFEVAPNDPLTLVLVVVVLGAMTFIASYIPARRILDLDPVAALRSK